MRRPGVEVWLVLGLSLGQSAVYAVVSLLVKLTHGGLRKNTATLNAARADSPWLDLTLQLLAIGFALVPVALALYFLSQDRTSFPERLGLARPWTDLRDGVLLAALIGIPGLGLYFVGREMGVTATVIPAPDHLLWWTIPVLILAAFQNAILEEIVVVAFLMTRLKQLRWPAVLLTSALIRGSYHLYQGFGAALGNVVMGLVFGYWYQRKRRVLPLIWAHALIDIVAFVGYLFVADAWGLR